MSVAVACLAVADPADLSLGDAVERLRCRELSPAELVDACLRRSQTCAELGGLVVVDEARARRAAAGSHPGPLYGAPLVVKDVIDVEGLPTRAGSRASSAAAAERDAPIVAGLRSRGAIVIAKSATHELAYGVTTPQVRNPRDPRITAGGSSGGSAAAIAVGAAPLALGSDTAGSVRIPAVCCGVSGMIGRAGRFSRAGVLPFSPSFDTLGPMVREPRDLRLAWAALTGVPRVPRTLSAVLVADPVDLGRVDAVALAGVESMVGRLGLPRRAAAIPSFVDWGEPRAIVIADEALRAHRSAGLYPEAAERLGDEIREAHLVAAKRPSQEVREARARLAELGKRLRNCVKPGTILLTPGLPGPPPAQDRPSREVVGWLTRLLAPVNAAGLAAAVVPEGPCGVQLIARDEDTVLAALDRLG